MYKWECSGDSLGRDILIISIKMNVMNLLCLPHRHRGLQRPIWWCPLVHCPPWSYHLVEDAEKWRIQCNCPTPEAIILFSVFKQKDPHTHTHHLLLYPLMWNTGKNVKTFAPCFALALPSGAWHPRRKKTDYHEVRYDDRRTDNNQLRTYRVIINKPSTRCSRPTRYFWRLFCDLNK